MIPDVSWAQVVYTLIITIPAIIAAWFAHRGTASLKTKNGKTVGEMVSEVHNAEVKK